MNTDKYLFDFNSAARLVDQKALSKQNIELFVGIFSDSVFLKMFKKNWTSEDQDPLTAESRIFFSVWVSDKTIKSEKLYYNIHAFKLRKLQGHNIQSREFAFGFRRRFKKFEQKWQNVSTDHGPLTLMEGWTELNHQTLQKDIARLAANFLEIADLIDSTLADFK